MLATVRGCLGGSGISAWTLCRKGFPIGPYRSVLEVLLLPDRHCLFQGIDDPAAGVEGRSAMGRSHGNQHTGLADFQPAKTMNDGNITNLEFVDRLRGQRFQLLESHILIGFVIQVQRPAAPGLIPYYTFEDQSSAVFAVFESVAE